MALQQVIELLKLPAGAKPGEVHAALNKPNEHGTLPIHFLLRDGDPGPGLVRAMLDAGGDAMLGVADDYRKYLPLHYAAWKLKNAGGPAVVELLLARGPPGSATSEASGAVLVKCSRTLRDSHRVGLRHPALLRREVQQGPRGGGDRGAAPRPSKIGWCTRGSKQDGG